MNGDWTTQIIAIIQSGREGNKFERILAQVLPFYETRSVYHCFSASGLEYEMEYLGKAKHDDQCFVAGTKIATIFGDKNIEDIEKGEYVITPYGINKVLESKCTGESEVIEKFGLIATNKHKIFYKNMFEPLDSCSVIDYICNNNYKELLKWKYKYLLLWINQSKLNLMEKPIELWEGRENIILVNQQTMMEEKVLKDFMLQFGNFIITKQFKKAFVFIIKMAILLITILVIWNIYQLGNIVRTIHKNIIPMKKIRKKLENILVKLETKLKNGMLVQKEKNGIDNMQKILYLNNLKQKLLKFVNGVKKNFQHQLKIPIIVVENVNKHVIIKHKEIKKYILIFVINVIKNILQMIKEKNSVVEHVVPQVVGKKEKVYNLTIENAGVFYANGILVSNCDSLCVAIHNMQDVYTATPRKQFEVDKDKKINYIKQVDWKVA
jgi:hypothetical protein